MVLLKPSTHTHTHTSPDSHFYFRFCVLFRLNRNWICSCFTLFFFIFFLGFCHVLTPIHKKFIKNPMKKRKTKTYWRQIHSFSFHSHKSIVKYSVDWAELRWKFFFFSFYILNHHVFLLIFDASTAFSIFTWAMQSKRICCRYW